MESDQMFGSLSSRGKLVLEAVWKDWLAMYGSQTSESDHHDIQQLFAKRGRSSLNNLFHTMESIPLDTNNLMQVVMCPARQFNGQMSEQGSLLDELFPLPVTWEDSKQRAATRAQEHLENSTKATKVFSQNNYSKPPHTNNANTNSVNLQACECIQTPAKEPNDSPCKGTTNCTSKSAQSRCIEESEVTFSSVFDESNFNDDFPYKHKYGMLKSNSPSHQTEEVYEVSDGGMKTLKNKNSNESFTSMQERIETPPSGLPPPTTTDTEENSKNENSELYPQNLIDLTDVSKTISNAMRDENVMNSFECLEQPADEGCVFKKPEIPLSKNKFGNQTRDCGLDWFYESHTAFNIKWAIRSECSFFSDLLELDSSVNSDFFENRFSANSIDKLMCNMYNDVESDAENVPEPHENFEISIDNDSVTEKIKSDVLGDAVLKRNVNTNDNSLIAASSQELSSEEFEDESPSSEFFHTEQKVSPKSVQSLQPPKCKTALVQHCGENKIQELCTKQCLKQRNNTELMFPERKAKSFNKRKFFKSPVIFQNSNVFADRNVLKNTEVLPTKIETGFCGFPVTSHDDMLFSGEDEFLQTKSQQENPIKQNTTFRIFKTKSFPQKNVENFVSKSSRVPMKLKQQKLDSFNFKIISNKKEESNIGAQNKFRTSKKIYSSGDIQVCTVDEPPVLNADIYSISEPDIEKSGVKLPLKAKINSNVSARKKIRFQQPTKLSFEKDSFLQETLKETDEIKFIFFTLTKELFEKVLNDLKQNIVQEICLATVYREGFCQLNKPLEHTMSTICNPKGIMLGVMDTNCDIKYYYFDVCSPSQMDESRDFILKLLNSQCRMICFEAQEMFAFLIDKFQFSPRQACIEWLMIDPLIGCWLLDPDHPVSSFRETLERLEVSTTVNDKLFQKADASADNDLNRCCHLLQTLSMVAEKLYERLSSQHLWELFTGVELKLMPLLAAMELRGICVDKSEFQKMDVLLKERAKLLQNAAHKAAGKQFLLTSQKQLRAILYDELKLDQKRGIHVKETSVLRAKSTSESMLRLLESVHSLPGLILEYRHIQKLSSTYVDGMLQQIKNSTIFTVWEQTATATGRITSSNPNLQAVPKHPVLLSSHIAKGFGHPPLLLRSPYVSRPGFTFLAADFQHIEFRVFAHLAQDPNLLRAFQQPGDIFLTLASLWLTPDGTSVCPEDREKTKRIVYSVMYGAGASKLAEFLQVNTAQANGIINSFIGRFPALRSFFNSVMNVCRQKGELRTFSGRRRLFPAINSLIPCLRSQAERQAINFLIQGTAADVCKAAMLRTELQLSQRPDIEAYLLLQIHDELLWEVQDSHLQQVEELVRAAMEDSTSLFSGTPSMTIPLPVIITTGKSWARMSSNDAV